MNFVICYTYIQIHGICQQFSTDNGMGLKILYTSGGYYIETYNYIIYIYIYIYIYNIYISICIRGV